MSAGVQPSPAGGPGSWLRRFPATTRREFAVVCLPHAGGAASFYRQWRQVLPSSVELVVLQYPGREDRFGDPLIASMAELADGVADALDQVDPPYVLFGHSMGASVAFEAAVRLETGDHPPRHLFVSARSAPSRPRPSIIHRGSDDELVEHLTSLGGTSAALLEDASVRELFLPMIRSDYRIAETYVNSSGVQVSCPVTVVMGDDDPEFSAAEAPAWQEMTTSRFDEVVLPGGHFYLVERRAEVVAEVLRRCRSGEPT